MVRITGTSPLSCLNTKTKTPQELKRRKSKRRRDRESNGWMGEGIRTVGGWVVTPSRRRCQPVGMEKMWQGVFARRVEQDSKEVRANELGKL
jgi:hypothetical protein